MTTEASAWVRIYIPYYIVRTGVGLRALSILCGLGNARACYARIGYVLLVRVLEVPAGTGIILRGVASTYKVPFGESTAYYLNLLVGNVESKTVEPTEGSYVNLYLTNGDDGSVFQRITTPYEMEANSAYLQLPARIAGGESNVKIAYEEDADAIRNALGTTDTSVYDIQGRKLASPQRGMNIIRMSDGTTRKVVVK